MIDVSVIIPAYNRLWCLQRAIDSCLHTHCNTEIIVVDDGSSDGTWEWLIQQKNVVAVYQKNQGQTYAINHGVSLAKGKYIRFLDSDDFLTEGIIDFQFNEAEKLGAALVCNRVDMYVEATGEIIGYPNIDWDDFLTIQLDTTYGSHFLGMLFKTDLVKLVPRRPDFALREDRMFLLEYGLLKPKIATLAGCAGFWVKHDSQMNDSYSGLKSQTANYQHYHIYKKILDELDARNELTEVRKLAASRSLFPLAERIAKSDLSTAIQIMKQINELNPSFKITRKDRIGKLYRYFGFRFTHKMLNLNRSLKELFR